MFKMNNHLIVNLNHFLCEPQMLCSWLSFNVITSVLQIFHHLMVSEPSVMFSFLAVCMVPPGPVTIPENNTVDIQVVKIISSSDVSLTVAVNPEDLFYIKGKTLMVKRGLDYEVILLKDR